MAISVNPTTHVITVPQADLTFVSGITYELDLNDFHLWLRDWEDDTEGIWQPKTHNHNPEVTLGGLTYARVVEVISPYTVEFEDGQYVVNCTGANHNLADVKVANQVSLIVNNAAGLIVSGSALTSEEQTKLDELHLLRGYTQGSPATFAPTQISAGGVTLTLTGDGENTTTVTRT